MASRDVPSRQRGCLEQGTKSRVTMLAVHLLKDTASRTRFSAVLVFLVPYNTLLTSKKGQ